MRGHRFGRLARLLPAWARPTHPIVRYQLRRWTHSRGWQQLNRLRWGGYGVLFFLPACCAVLLASTVASNSDTPGAVILSIGGLVAVGLFAASTLSLWFSTLTAAVLGATLIAGERENQTWTFLRLTSLSSLEIVGSKLAAVGYLLARPIRVILVLRLCAVLIGLATVALAIAVTDLTLRDLGEFVVLSPLALAGFTPLGLGGGALVGVANWFIEPISGLVYSAVVGLAASSLARSRGTAIVLMVAAHFALWLGIQFPVQQVAILLLSPLFALASRYDVRALSFFGDYALVSWVIAFLQTWLGVGTWLAIVGGCLAFTLWRLNRLAE